MHCWGPLSRANAELRQNSDSLLRHINYINYAGLLVTKAILDNDMLMLTQVHHHVILMQQHSEKEKVLSLSLHLPLCFSLSDFLQLLLPLQSKVNLEVDTSQTPLNNE